ncbi:MAG TPA: hypothetical protein VLL08_15485 [Kineosporiaceae bacterium]|nr:hypothetical protein [Kineosporiaceae bacterium]
MDIDQQLRRLDPAAEIPEDLGRSARAEAVLASITSTHPDGGQIPVRSRRRPWRRYLLAAATAVGVLVAPVLGGSTAYASWTAVPRMVTAQEAKAFGQECLKSWSSEDTDVDYQVRLVEARGLWSYTVLTGAGGREAACLFKRSPDRDGTSQGGGFSGKLVQTPAADALVTNSVGEVQLAAGDDHQLAVTGKAGANVASVAFRIDGTDVQATLKDGYFAAWWPQRDGKTLLSRMADVVNGGGPPNPKVVITLLDGTTRIARIQQFDVSPM